MNQDSYIHLLESVKTRIHAAQHQVAMYVNSELLFTYWQIGICSTRKEMNKAGAPRSWISSHKILKAAFLR